MDDIVTGVCYRPPGREEVDKAFFGQLEEPKYKNDEYIYLKPERFYTHKPKTVVRHHGTWSTTQEGAWASAYRRPQPRWSSGGGCHHPSLRQGTASVSLWRDTCPGWGAVGRRRSWGGGEQLHTVRENEQEIDRLFAEAEQPRGPFQMELFHDSVIRGQMNVSRSSSIGAWRKILSTGNLVTGRMNRFVELW